MLEQEQAVLNGEKRRQPTHPKSKELTSSTKEAQRRRGKERSGRSERWEEVDKDGQGAEAGEEREGN